MEALAALAATLQQAEQQLSEYAAAEEEITLSLKLATERYTRESKQIAAAIATIDQRSKEEKESGQAAVRAIGAELAGLSPGFDLASLRTADATLRTCRAQLEAQDQAFLKATREEALLQAELIAARARAAEAANARAEVTRIEGELGWWNLLGKALSNDGVIALCVDGAGPELARLANELLLACYGPRFTVAIHTQVETAKKQLREGFDVIVFDARIGQCEERCGPKR